VQKDTPKHHSEFTIDFPTSPAWFKAVRMLLTTASTQCGFPDRTAGQIAMAVDEALCNIHQHGYKSQFGRAYLTATTTIDPLPRITIRIEDDAKQIDIEQIKSRNLEAIRPGGLGVHLIQTVMDEVVWSKRDEGGMCVTMNKTSESISVLEVEKEIKTHE
jgi:anti-sigma regulatory factor (Ser/Thr protein kinase)